VFIFVIIFFFECRHNVTLKSSIFQFEFSRIHSNSTLVITTITGMPSEFVRTPSGSGKTTCSSPLFTLIGVVVDAIETDEIEFGIRPFLSVTDDDDDAIMIDASFGSM